MEDALDLGDLESSLGALDRALQLMDDEARVAVLGEDGPMIVMTYAIKSFELTYETSLRFMLRRLERDRPEVDLKALTHNDRLRVAAESGLIREPRSWFGFRTLRNRTVHTYNREQASAVVADVPAFAAEAKALLANLRARND